MPKPPDKPKDLAPVAPFEKRSTEVTTPIDVSKLAELIEETERKRDEEQAKKEAEGRSDEPPEGLQSTPAEATSADAEAEFASDGGSIAEALMRATNNFPSVGRLGSGSEPDGGAPVADSALTGTSRAVGQQAPDSTTGAQFRAVTATSRAVTARPASVRPPSEEFEASNDTNPQGVLRRAKALEAAGAHQTALEHCERMLAAGVGDSTEVRSMAQRLRSTLAEQAEEKLGSLAQAPHARLSPAELRERKLDPKAAFLLSQVDGRMSYQELLSVSGMSRFETLLVLAKLREAGLITTD